MIETGSSENFLEIDAATHSGKDDVGRIIEQISYSTFSGKRRIYLFDEAHRLSKEAFDALLKPMEETVLGTSNKRLICIFATTEPTKMRKTILSRCAPLFFLPHLPSTEIAERLAFICGQEGVGFEKEALVLISELKENHIRDSIKTLEMLSLVGKVTLNLVQEQFHFNLNELYLEVLEGLVGDVQKSVSTVKEIFVYHSPSEVYGKLAELSWLCFSVCSGWSEAGSIWDQKRLEKVFSKVGDRLIRFAEFFSSRPYNPTMSMVCCDLMLLSGKIKSVKIPQQIPIIEMVPVIQEIEEPKKSVEKPEEKEEDPPEEESVSIVGSAPINRKERNKAGKIEVPRRNSPNLGKAETRSGVYLDPRGIKKPKDTKVEKVSEAPKIPETSINPVSLSAPEFVEIVSTRFSEENGKKISAETFGKLLKVFYNNKTKSGGLSSEEVPIEVLPERGDF